MRRIPALLVSTVAVLLCSSISHAQESPTLQQRIAVRRDLERAKMNLRHYWQVEYPRKCRELDSAIECTRAEIDNGYSLLREYQPYSTFSIGQPFPITIRNLKMNITCAEARLNDLLAERSALVRYHSDEFRVLAADVYEARLRVVDLEANIPISSDLPEPTAPQN